MECITSHKVTVRISEQLSRQTYSEHSRWSILQKEQCLSIGTQPEIFQGREDFLELEHFNKHLFKNTRTNGPTGKHYGAFSPKYY